ncbi:MAG: hypothetical protein EWV89_22270 [Microcystis wesenbergii Mw_QC_B_20070930_S4]|nr:MAG: hypothetical protein EWV73_11405 [Microcystis wesenbergii Mw_QC_B_20070930_S4D]TRV07523.1 MAG: hypothetical protein EWV89_22270 [Microcystis wesenbergii Mw_QC_B_20070930_S4]
MTITRTLSIFFPSFAELGDDSIILAFGLLEPFLNIDFTPFPFLEFHFLIFIRQSPVWEHLTFVTPKSGFMSSSFESLARNQFEGQV